MKKFPSALFHKFQRILSFPQSVSGNLGFLLSLPLQAVSRGRNDKLVKINVTVH